MNTGDLDDFRAMRALLAHLPAAARGGMVRMYVQSLGEHLAQVEQGLQPGGDAALLLHAVHRMAGAAGMMQDTALCDAARAMEVALREGTPQQAGALWPQVQARAAATRAMLAQHEAGA